ncbi:hypothetical protein [Dictyobacter kobayashii]|uniref:Uncharacterized protein n=1 Tax=Dictyobacter kobayashii TaxID=2014872 RepID=A0A402ANE6_9CHLR|nr:hypothetical protein [Dictyobacter kobayashii]GCE20612.1 hypothetical protein KDK_44120 [Dictyobacter kobayashii]
MLDAQHGKLIHSIKMNGEKMSRPYVANGWIFITNSEINAFQLL